MSGKITASTTGRVGGVVGSAYATQITNVVSDISVTNSGNGPTGGLVGYFGGNAGGHSSQITNCAVYDNVSGGNRAGGLVGAIWNGNQSCRIENVVYVGNISGQCAGALIGYNGNQAGNTSYLLNAYYNIDSDISYLGGSGSGVLDSNAEAVTLQQLASGEVAYRLGEAWGQNLMKM